MEVHAWIMEIQAWSMEIQKKGLKFRFNENSSLQRCISSFPLGVYLTWPLQYI